MGNRGKFAIAGLMLVALAQHGYSTERLEAGTVIVVSHSKDRAIFAADSRAVLDDGVKTRINDDDCKLSTVQGQLGFAGFGSDGSLQWRAGEHAKDIAENFLRSSGRISEGAAEDIASTWAHEVMDWLREGGDARVQRLRSLVKSEKLMGGVFALRLDDGALAYREVEFVLNGQPPTYSHVSFKIEPLTASAQGQFSAFGAVDVFALFFADSKPRYIADELARWAALPKGSDLKAFQTRRIAELTIEHSEHKDTVGGHVNVLEMSAAGIRWITDNHECKDK